MYKTTDYDYHLPEELIAQEPLSKRDRSRLLVLHRESGLIEHRQFNHIGEYLRPGDTLVINDTKVLPARLYGRRKNTGAKIEVLLLEQLEGSRWEVLVKPGRRAKVGDTIVFDDGRRVLMEADIIDSTDTGGRVLEFTYSGQFLELLDRIGTMPLPPYIKKELQDKQRYQTVYAQREGSAAAPTAGLHFTRELLQQLQQQGINVARVLLHVGLGTFRPVKVEDIREHKMHREYYEITPETAGIINKTKERGGRVIAVGTTSVRTLETAAGEDGEIHPAKGWTDIFIYPGYKFKCIDGLITNFHLPKSTLLMLVSAFAGREKIMAAYQEAVKKEYRFFSFGDAMLII
ncbi:S-adenosylmethionine:tRNA ribosyltransferase-isomerase [Desulfohalotomaculum tongense]|uniref:tRNA preQ1(34) S-adenosylmethionine ribosyltransferase-isomerase QueA n=1 Tax=Desulforadius tongensis TaxID=1216062 RepID=UPI00195B0331|nr:tRNA preQ1(34) S-adenosylmethionine ribosyltransferase-isomerase QueA [Desulforadius tongensis]MBM7855120.1 S-adenosylmethionine:tRNA ribosyltransferase-isomerase [Desulforadius tongensis]